jgi:predicted peptidase
MLKISLFLIVLFLTIACREEEEVIPLPPPAATIPQQAEPEQEEAVAPPPANVNLEDFQSAIFDEMPYRILYPRGYDSLKVYPLHIFLHGVGERGTDNERQLAVGSKHFQVDSVRQKYPAFVIFPQCPSSAYWFDERIVEKLTALINDVVRKRSIDKHNISIGGFSMGAYGTFAMVTKNPQLFVSAIAIAGDGDEENARRMAKSKWRLFAGEKDNVVPSKKTEKMAKALKKAGAHVSFTLYPNADHGATWHRAFAEPDFFKWLFRKPGV